MDFETVVMYYLAAQGLFLSPQFSVRDGAGEWSCPDFVALDFGKREVQIVEVTTAYDVSGLIGKFQNRDEQWYRRINPQLKRLGAIDDNWAFAARAFVRKDRLAYVRSKLADSKDVRVEAIEEVAFSWKWPWEEWSKG